MVPPKDGWMDLDNHEATTDEIRALVSDLGVLGKADFKLLLRWRLTIRKQAAHRAISGATRYRRLRLRIYRRRHTHYRRDRLAG